MVGKLLNKNLNSTPSYSLCKNTKSKHCVGTIWLTLVKVYTGTV